MAGTFRRTPASLAAAIGCTEAEYLAELRAGREWCSRCPDPETGKLGHWVDGTDMCMSTVRMCKKAQLRLRSERSRRARTNGEEA